MRSCVLQLILTSQQLNDMIARPPFHTLSLSQSNHNNGHWSPFRSIVRGLNHFPPKPQRCIFSFQVSTGIAFEEIQRGLF